MRELLKFLKMATTARLIDWKPTGEEIDVKKYGYESVSICRGYEAQIGEFKVKTIIREKKLRRSTKLCWAISVKKGDETIVLTEKMVGDIDVWILCRHVQAEMESRDLPNQLRQHLARLMAQ